MLTPRSLIDSAVRSVCGREVGRLAPVTAGEQNETYSIQFSDAPPAIVRISRRPGPWFADEGHIMALARAVGVPTPGVLGVHHIEHDGEMLSFSVLELVPGRSLAELAGGLRAEDLDRLLLDCGELLARVHTISTDQGVGHELSPRADNVIERALRTARDGLGEDAAAMVEGGARRLGEHLRNEPAPPLVLVHGDWLPKHVMVDEGEIVGVIDWEFAGPGSPGRDLARWYVQAGDAVDDRANSFRRGYARIADPTSHDRWVAAFAIDWCLHGLSRQNPASSERQRRYVDVVAKYSPLLG